MRYEKTQPVHNFEAIVHECADFDEVTSIFTVVLDIFNLRSILRQVPGEAVLILGLTARYLRSWYPDEIGSVLVMVVDDTCWRVTFEFRIAEHCTKTEDTYLGGSIEGLPNSWKVG